VNLTMQTLKVIESCIQKVDGMTRSTGGAEPLTWERLARAKSAYSTRRVELTVATHLLSGDALQPCAGDLVLAQVEKLGQHTRIEQPSGRRAQLYPGDEIIVCYGNRYAPDQFEALVPEHLEECCLVAAGGIAAQLLSRHRSMKHPTVIQPLGLLADDAGHRLNLMDWALPRMPSALHRPHTLAVVGTAMNAGKTTTAAHLIRGLVQTGHRVGAAKVTGTGAGGDRWTLLDAGAERVLDFTDAGHASTYRVALPQVEMILHQLIAHLASEPLDAVVLEVADGLCQTETARLLASPAFARRVDGVVFAAGDALGARAGVEWLRRHALPVWAVSGLLTASPLACREAEVATGLPVLTQDQLAQGGWRTERKRSAAGGGPICRFPQRDAIAARAY